MTKKLWPVPNSFNREIPVNNTQGSFWEDRLDRNHAGVDIYAPHGADILAVEGGTVLEVRIFTSPEMIRYWNVTYYILLKTDSDLIIRYAEMEDVCVTQGQQVKTGELLGHVGKVLNPEKIDTTSPQYIQKLKEKNLPAMLHFEIYSAIPQDTADYLGGNYFNGKKPANIINPTEYLNSIK